MKAWALHLSPWNLQGNKDEAELKLSNDMKDNAKWQIAGEQ